jgi:hypothetical protein
VYVPSEPDSQFGEVGASPTFAHFFSYKPYLDDCQGTFGILQGTFGILQGTFGLIQETFGLIQGTFGLIQGTFGLI